MFIVMNEWVPFTVLQCLGEYYFINVDQQNCSFFLNGYHGNNHMTGSKLKQNSYLCSLGLLVQVDSGDKVMQHQAYQPILPSVNKYLQYRWDKHCYEMHRRKVKSAKPTITTTPPQTYNHLIVKPKKQQLEEERVTRIKRENHLLLDKMSHIMQTAGGVDCKNNYVQKSLGKDKRQLELLHITKENQRILQRLSTCRPHYNIQVWHNQWLKNTEFKDNISRYPRQYLQGSLPPISAERHGTVVHDRLKNKYTARHVHEESANMIKEKECDEKTKSEVKVISEDEK